MEAAAHCLTVPQKHVILHLDRYLNDTKGTKGWIEDEVSKDI